MKFKVRAGYAVHLTRTRVVEQAGRQVKQVGHTSHFENEVIELAPEEVADHLAKIEPADKEAAAFISPKAA